MIEPTVSSIRALSDNFIHIIHDNRSAIAVDPASASPVLTFLKKRNLSLSHVLVTHHHADHIGGCPGLKKATGCTVIGPDDARICCLDETETSSLPIRSDIITTPGHTSSHICYHLPDLNCIFSGDALFLGGCGRLFEGSAKQMWSSLLKLRQLPPETDVYPGHDYTLDNLEFCESVFPGIESIKQRLEKARTDGTPTHAPLAEEIQTNVFLMCDDPHFTELTGLTGYPADIFAELRKRKDSW